MVIRLPSDQPNIYGVCVSTTGECESNIALHMSIVSDALRLIRQDHPLGHCNTTGTAFREHLSIFRCDSCPCLENLLICAIQAVFVARCNSSPLVNPY